ncbi:NEK/NEK6 protein kinase [Allomyces macrogynus ATCC 38327]|uniref:NEK6-subfamily protein kinase n=1 Tax=Allomyces macrogynus (strain ATCC 38327) TaxID=578462 RepID=A0A0L0TE96_ALLM3|nr:NEK/NEK6 protein kinase [Allomyces macrogynus ATCC 38327]|eukprot:KNE73072.1 NEK/NEK6 protein kinase [Allomyces macrogynus ATCC 38327]
MATAMPDQTVSIKAEDLPTIPSEIADLAKYQVEKKIGKGQFSTVFRARNSENGQIVALKTMQMAEMDAKSRYDCIKEMDLLKSLNHPNIIQPLASYLHQDELIIVLELADAGDLGKMFKHFKSLDQYIPEKTIWYYFSQIAAGINHMHTKRIMHRDIKPANIFLTSTGQVKLGDLGLGRFFSPKTSAAHSLVGTPYYMSPERIHETGYDFKSDIWSLGCVLYEFAALHSPFYGDKMNLYTLCKKIEKVDYPKLKGDLSKEFKGLVTEMIQLDPEKRPTCETVYQVSTEMHKKFQTKS